MNRESPPTWVSFLKWGLALPVALAAVYFGSYAWLWHTKSGQPVHEWSSYGRSPEWVKKVYAQFYYPARRAELAWRVASFGRKLGGTWATEDEAVRLRFKGADIVDVQGLSEWGIPDGSQFSGAGLCGEALYLKSVERSSSYMTAPPGSIGRDTCVVRVSARGRPPVLKLHRVASTDGAGDR